MKQYGALDDTFYMWFGANDTSGSGGDGASPAADVRLAGAAVGAAPVYSPTPSLLSHVNYPAGAYEIAITASVANGFATGNTYAVFCTLAIDSQNPTGFVGSFDLKPVESNPTQIGDSTQSLTDLKDFADAGYDPGSNKITGTADMRGTDSAALASEYTAGRAAYIDNLSAGAVALAAGVDLTKIHGVALTETVNGYLAAAFVKLFDVATPLLVASEVMRGTDSALTDKAGFALSAIGADLILKDSTFALAIADATWDEIITEATHGIATSAGKRMLEVGAYAIHDGTAQAGGNVQITLAATATATDGIYNRNLLVLSDGTGKGQTRTIIEYNGTTKIAIIDREWRVNPDATSKYQIVADDTPLVSDQGIAQAGTSNTITLRAYASATNDIYLCNVVIIVAGTGRGQARLAGAYNGTTKIITICGDNWTTTPDNTSVYVMIPYGASCACCICDHALGQINAECDTALTDYNPPTRTEATTDKNAIITEVNANETKIDALNNISVADIIAGIADGSNDLQEMIRIMFAALSGKSSGGGTTTLKFRDSGDAKDRITATVDGDGNRTAMALDGSS